jgi:hypothetical protein
MGRLETDKIYYIGCEVVVAGQLFKRLETEGQLFILSENLFRYNTKFQASLPQKLL